MKRSLAAAAAATPLLLAATATCAASDPWSAPFTIQVGAFRADASTTARFDSESGRLGTEVSFESTLGITRTKTLPQIDFLWRINPRHGLEVSWVSLERSGDRTLDGSINWGEATFPINTTVNSRFDSETFRVAYRYSPWNADGNELALLLGLHYTTLKAAIQGTAGTLSDEVSVDFPMPTIGARGSVKFADRWRLTGYLQFLKVKAGDYDGTVGNASVGVEWAFLPQAYAGVGYNYYKYDLESEKSRGRGKYTYKFDGPMLYAAWAF